MGNITAVAVSALLVHNNGNPSLDLSDTVLVEASFDQKSNAFFCAGFKDALVYSTLDPWLLILHLHAVFP